MGTGILLGLTAALLAVGGALTSCAPPPGEGAGPRVVQPGAPGSPSRVRVAPPPGTGDAGYTAAEVQFMGQMIVHHAQALVLSRMAVSRTVQEEVLGLARRIERSQTDEIGLMQSWLESRDEPTPDPPVEFETWLVRTPDSMSMHGMLTASELRELDRAEGPDFDRRFLIAMIRHHRGALTMLEELFADPGSAGGGQIFQLASDLGSDQRIEIARMGELLERLDAP